MPKTYTHKIFTYFGKAINESSNDKCGNDNKENHANSLPLYESGKHDLIIGLLGLIIVSIVVKYLYSISIIKFLQIFFIPEALTIKYSDQLMLIGFLIWCFASFVIYGVFTVLKSLTENFMAKVLLTLASIIFMFLMPVSAYIRWPVYYFHNGQHLWDMRISFLCFIFIYFSAFRIRLFLDV